MESDMRRWFQLSPASDLPKSALRKRGREERTSLTPLSADVAQRLPFYPCPSALKDIRGNIEFRQRYTSRQAKRFHVNSWRLKTEFRSSLPDARVNYCSKSRKTISSRKRPMGVKKKFDESRRAQRVPNPACDTQSQARTGVSTLLALRPQLVRDWVLWYHTH